MSGRRALLSLLMGAESVGPKNYTIERERGRRRRGADLLVPEGKLHAQKRKGPSARALISSEGRGITRPRKLHARKRKGQSVEGAWITRRLEKITRSKEKGAVGAPRAYICYEGAESLDRKITRSKEKGAAGSP